ncbi:Protein of unknown function [Cotesia congregata]|uniref:Uncharacterized protein n=1 Tax=Cotesia congregata TaxID=51543 RepID=A0A8J2HR75_COTCN|nr:Protein of unknown function [Cotesia congregata]
MTLELASRMFNDQLIVSGKPETPSEDLVHTVTRLDSVRIDKKRRSTGSRDIMVECKSPQLVSNFIAEKRKHKNFTANILDSEMDRIYKEEYIDC